MTRGTARIEPDPYRRQPLTRVASGPGVVRLLLDRSAESAERGEPSQDFVVVDLAPAHVCFAVTDGVGSSFLGDLAAAFLARHVVDWLAALNAVPDEDGLAAGLTELFDAIAPAADEMVESYPLPSDVPEVIREALDQKRAYGSEAMVACGRIEWPQSEHARVGVAWLGDSQLRVLHSRDAALDLRGSTSDRWSSRRGPRGEVRARVWPAREIERVVACSDGLLAELDAAVSLTDAELDPRLAALAETATSDDMALVDVALDRSAMPPSGGGVPPVEARRPSEASMPAEPPAAQPLLGEAPEADGADATIAAPGPPLWRRGEDGHRLSWAPVSEAEAYTLELAHNPEFHEPLTYAVDEPSFTIPALATPMWARVRAHAGARRGPWGEAAELGVRTADPQPGRPSGLRSFYRGRGIVELRWDAVSEATGYRVEVDDFRVPGELWARRERADLHLRPGVYRLRVRADSRGSRWSEPIELQIPSR